MGLSGVELFLVVAGDVRRNLSGFFLQLSGTELCFAIGYVAGVPIFSQDPPSGCFGFILFVGHADGKVLVCLHISGIEDLFVVWFIGAGAGADLCKQHLSGIVQFPPTGGHLDSVLLDW